MTFNSELITRNPSHVKLETCNSQLETRLTSNVKSKIPKQSGRLTSNSQLPTLLCKRCHSGRIIKSGLFHGLQRYCCKDCGSVFILNQAPFHSRLPIEAVVVALESFFNAEPLDSIRQTIEKSLGFPITVTGLEKMVYRFSHQAVELAGDITPHVGPRWYLDATFFNGTRPVVILDVLDLKTGFLIASDVVPDYAEKDRESVTKRALRVTGATPELLQLSPDLANVYEGLGSEVALSKKRLKKDQNIVIHNFGHSAISRTKIISRRLNFDSISNCRLICSAWRVHYNFLSGFQPVSNCSYNTWLDIVTSSRSKEL